jgi:hypothetical protein
VLDLGTTYVLLACGYFGHGMASIACERCKSRVTKRLWKRTEHALTVFLGLACLSAAIGYIAH